MKSIHSIWRAAGIVLTLWLAGTAEAAGPFTLTTTNDSHALSAATSATNSAGLISLRSAIEAANNQAGATIINVPPGLYNLALGELAIATNGNHTLTIQASGGTAANTIINQTNGNDRVFNIDINSVGSANVTLVGLTLQGGHDKTDLLGGACILAGSISATPKDVLTLNSCVLTNNHCYQPNTNYTAQIGGAIQMSGGDLTLLNCTLANNSSGASLGGAIAFFSQTVASSLYISNSIFTGNYLTNTSGSGPDGGGAIFIGSTAGSTHTILNTLFSNNVAAATYGTTYGGAIQINTGTLNITNSTFVNNRASAQGGAIDVDAGTLNLAYSRLVANSATTGSTLYNHNGNGAVTVAVNNWWSCNNGPGASGCGVAITDVAGLTVTPFIVFTNVANPASILPNQATAITASFLQNSAGTALTLAQISPLLGLPVNWGSGINGTLTSPQTSIQANGTVTNRFVAGSVAGTGQALATVDGATAVAYINIVCPSIVGTVSGSATSCAGQPNVVAVAVSGGIPPYSVTLNNGGGTQSGTGPTFYFSVSPTVTTTYQVSTGSDSESCPIANSGSATITIQPPALSTITASPASVLPDTVANTAAGPAGQTSYAWSISNGYLNGPTNQATVLYTSGNNGNVTLTLTTTSPGGCSTSTSSLAVPITPNLSIRPTLVFTNNQPLHTMGITFDGTNYWDCGGGGTSGNQWERYSATGSLLNSYAPGLDFRSVTVSPNGTVVARLASSSILYAQTSPGVLAPLSFSLTNSVPDSQAAVVYNGPKTEFISMSAGVVSRWTTNGAYLGTVALQGYGAVSGESVYPQNRGIAAYGNWWLTYNGTNILSAWDTTGNRLFQMYLPGAGTNFDAAFSFSCCNGKVFIADGIHGNWRSYDLGANGSVAVIAAESNIPYNVDVTNKLLATKAVASVDLFRYITNDILPTATQLNGYAALLIYSDAAFGDPAAIGNALANYSDQGGGLVLSTFDFYSTPGLGFAGRLTNGYLPFTLATQSGASGQTLVKDLPASPLLDGVNSFNGGSSSFMNFSITNAPGATGIAHWANGQPLVAVGSNTLNRVVGLNFFPPSSDARADFWVASTDGAKLIGNAMAYAGRIAPFILNYPSNQVAGVGAAVTFAVTAGGAGPLAYQWIYNGTNLPSATNVSLTITAGPTRYGIYSVLVTNAYGGLLTAGVTLSPALKFGPPNQTGNTLNLSLVTADGSVPPANRLYRLQVYAGTNLAQPFNQWLLLTNNLTLVGNQFQLSPLTITNTGNRFFRMVELP
ncbi:MAG TPA: hypothetical protein VF607_15580 [Verrucomicrobiae bacterium]